MRFSVKRKLVGTGRAYSDISDIFDICKRRSGKMSSLTAFASSESIIHFLANILAKKFLLQTVVGISCGLKITPYTVPLCPIQVQV